MAIRRIRKDGDEILRKISKEVEVIDEKVLKLLDDMADTMYKYEGVGLAAVQVGILRRIVVIDINDNNGLLELINPGIIDCEGEQEKTEGCLSCPGVFGDVKRPEKVTVKALNRKGEEITVKAKGLLSIALCHELDHLDGKLFKDIASNISNEGE